MAHKRTRAEYEASLQAQQSPFVIYGTPLPPLDPEVRDDGSFVPVWEQEVRDERGRKRLHGAFTGGWSAGYFNTVGSKEGWTPSTFTSSRTNRHKDKKDAPQQRAEDYMDEEDLAEAEEAKSLQTNAAFSGLGATENDARRANGLTGLLRSDENSTGKKLLRAMGWKDGQGIGPKVRRKAELDMPGSKVASGDAGETHLFAPQNVPMIALVRKTDSKGLGFDAPEKLAALSLSNTDPGSDEEVDDKPKKRDGPKFSLASAMKKKKGPSSGIGMGVLNDTGSDDEDPYSVGPRISYSKVLGGTRKKDKRPGAEVIKPAVTSKPIAKPKNVLSSNATTTLQSHDGRPPLPGFTLSISKDSNISLLTVKDNYAPPIIPPGWTPRKQTGSNGTQTYLSTADAAKASTMDHKSRAALLGEQALPGKSVFDFLSPAARDRVAAVTGRSNLPQGKGEVPQGYALNEQEKQAELLKSIPAIDKKSAFEALNAHGRGGGPYGDDEGKRTRYRTYLEYYAQIPRAQPPIKPATMAKDDWMREMYEFQSTARLARPLSGVMASRFSKPSSLKAPDKDGESGAVAITASKPEDPAEAAAKVGMYGHLTRSVKEWYPTRLLCKRFNVKSPAHVRPDNDGNASEKPQAAPQRWAAPVLLAAIERGSLPEDSNPSISQTVPEAQQVEVDPGLVDAERNAALEGQRASEEVFKAIFGDDSDDDD